MRIFTWCRPSIGVSAFVMIMSIVIVAGSSAATSKPSIHQNQTTSIRSVSLVFQVVAAGNMGVKVVGTTNLPEGMELLSTLDGKTTNFMGSSDLIVRNGRFESETFGSDKGLLPGQYVIEITSPMSILQPDRVQALIGENGKNLKGKALRKRDGDTVVEIKQPFQLYKDGSISLKEDKKAIQVAQSETRTTVREYLAALKKLEAKGRALEPLRQKDVPSCMKNIQARKEEAKVLRSNIEGANLPLEYSLPLGMAAMELSLCVTCSQTLAPDFCERARVHIGDVEKVLRQGQ